MTSDSREGRLATVLRSARGLPRRLAHAGRVALDILCWAATFQLLSRLRLRRDTRLIRRSGLFDVRFYLSQCGEDAEARKDPVTHYLVDGAARGLEPNPLFDTRAYLEQNPAAGGPRQNPLVHFIRTGGSAARTAAAEVATEAPAAPISPGEALLRGHPFRVVEPEESGDAPRVLVVERSTPTAAGDGRSARTFGLVVLLRDIGCGVTVVTDGGETQGDLEDALGRLGIDVHRGFSAALAHLAVEGHRYRWALLAGPEASFRFLPAVRAYCTQAKVIYDTFHAGRLRPLDRRGSLGDAGDVDVERLERIVRADASCSDLVFVATPAEREALAATWCAARIEVVPDPRGEADAARARERIRSLFLGTAVGGEGAPRNEEGHAWMA